MRFDLTVTNDMKVYLIEANMSPNLSSTRHIENGLLYEQILYNTLALVGIGTRIDHYLYLSPEKKTQAMMSTTKNIVVNGDICLACNTTCTEKCRLCLHCLSNDDIYSLNQAYLEHINRGDTKRIFPVPIEDRSKGLDSVEISKLSPANAMMTKWFYGKCLHDKSWCA